MTVRHKSVCHRLSRAICLLLLLSLALQRVASSSGANDRTYAQSTEHPSTHSTSNIIQDLLIVSTVDGTLAGVSKRDGRLLWVQSGQSSSGTACATNRKTGTMNNQLIRCRLLDPLVSTTTTYSDSHIHAVPSIDGSVYLTHQDVTLQSHVQDLLSHSPFVDSAGRLYTARKSSSVTALDATTGDVVAIYDDHDYRKDTVENRGHWVWMGRNDYQVSIHQPKASSSRTKPAAEQSTSSSTGATIASDLSFTISELLSADDMLLESQLQPSWPGDRSETRMPDANLLPMTAARLLSTPSGVCAYQGNSVWTLQLASPVVYAMDAATGTSVHIDLVEDAVKPDDADDYLLEALQKHAIYDDELQDATTVVGTLSNGQVYAMPLRRTSALPIQSLAEESKAHHAATLSSTSSLMQQLSHPHAIRSDVGGRSSSTTTSSSIATRACAPGRPNYPACLIGHQHQPLLRDRSEQFVVSVNEQQNNAMVPLYHPNYEQYGKQLPPEYDAEPLRENRTRRTLLRIFGSWLPPTIALVFVLSFELGRRKRQRDLKKTKHTLQRASGSAQQASVGMIHVQEDVILGYGGHGTVVYRGTLEGREVAVKRMLKAYHASADREISLLIESDGHPNVVRYFLKEVRGDFVYLALELCDLSLHDLIAVLRTRYDKTYTPSRTSIPQATRVILLQVANGVKHLHRLRIVHRDLKPANILLADSKKSRRKKRKDEENSFFSIYQKGEYVAKISDMGLGKQLVGQSSFGGSTLDASLRGQSNGGQSSLVVAGPGSVGWQAPEVMAVRVISDVSVKSDGSGVMQSVSETSPADPSNAGRTSRSVDIFSLGCIFYSALLPGSHPFGEWYERESNIMHNRPSIETLEALSPEAHDLVRAMIHRYPSHRPTARQVCDHPFFWNAAKRIAFVCEFSDRLENETLVVDGDLPASALVKLLAVERNAISIVGTSWDKKLDGDLVSNVQKFRSYDPSSVRDLLRLIRNKYHHFDELPEVMKAKMNRGTDGLMTYFEERFPSLVIHCYRAAMIVFSSHDPFVEKYSICIQSSTGDGRSAPVEPVVKPSFSTHVVDSGPSVELEPLVEDSAISVAEYKAMMGSDTPTEHYTVKEHHENAAMEPQADVAAEPEAWPDVSTENQTLLPGDDEGVIIWEGSTTAMTLNCRGWHRPDDEWTRCVDAQLRKRNKNLIRCAEDAKFRTRLCNHWDESRGTFCPMRKKGKCVFAHGPVELRVKEGKRNRWGKLVDKNGDNKNPKHSGGEDTYGAARSIEAERKEEGKWGGKSGGGGAKSKAKSNK